MLQSYMLTHDAKHIGDVLNNLNAGYINKNTLVDPEVFEAVEAIIKAGEAASKLIYGEGK